MNIPSYDAASPGPGYEASVVRSDSSGNCLGPEASAEQSQDESVSIGYQTLVITTEYENVKIGSEEQLNGPIGYRSFIPDQNPTGNA